MAEAGSTLTTRRSEKALPTTAMATSSTPVTTTRPGTSCKGTAAGMGRLSNQAVAAPMANDTAPSTTAWLLSRPIPAAVPLQLVPGRVVVTGVLLVVMAVVGSAFSLRRVVKVDPASAIG